MTETTAVVDLPKTELHLHLEGAAPPAFIARLAQEKGLDLSAVIEGDTYIYTDFPAFLAAYEAVSACLQTPDDYRRLTRAVLEQSRDEGVIYTELFVAPSITGSSMADWAEYLAGMEAGADDVPEVECRFISTAVRHMGAEVARQTAEVTVAHLSPRLTGWGMGGNESTFAPRDFAVAFDIAREAGLGITTHAGEIEGPESVRDSLDALRPSRIGHGVRAWEDPELVARLVAEDITLEVNPGSNIRLGVYPAIEQHTIQKLRSAGVKVTVSTDDPPYFHTTMRKEYAELNRVFGWTRSDFDAINRTAMDAAFCDAATRARLRANFEGDRA
ncbi:adenosine deaminase [Pontivivens insulae]|uniref:Aminodeoxyfutalosine deaminase n=1 Tax=Pontivivens insulae TaxID=1639689 RepID=A0A2R8ADM0_9RHOB|nr:adenosine deaminase [Pontivivens insulae]RED14262.1 adenosine deaminase [Pontivivens insulae]SPF30337.1 Aminodeoxyfutalosine deaminase [Pontivivens insulae]